VVHEERLPLFRASESCKASRVRATGHAFCRNIVPDASVNRASPGLHPSLTFRALAS
jgi:hypothetical protein